MFLALAACPLAGCVGTFETASGYDAQGCVEDALRRRPSADILAGAGEEFELGCRAKDPGACSALGVLYELGLDRPANQAAARELYQRACRGGNPRGCVNLGRLVLANAAPGSADVSVAVALWQHACASNEKSGCAELAAFSSRGAPGAPPRPPPSDRRLAGAGGASGALRGETFQ